MKYYARNTENYISASRFWIGSTDAATEGIWAWASDGSVSGTYDTSIGGFKIKAGEPNNGGGIERCGGMYNGEFIDSSCTSGLLPLCQMPCIILFSHPNHIMAILITPKLH